MKINELCKLLNIAEPTLAEKIRNLQIKVDKLKVRKRHKISGTPEKSAGKYDAFYTAMYP